MFHLSITIIINAHFVGVSEGEKGRDSDREEREIRERAEREQRERRERGERERRKCDCVSEKICVFLC